MKSIEDTVKSLVHNCMLESVWDSAWNCVLGGSKKNYVYYFVRRHVWMPVRDGVGRPIYNHVFLKSKELLNENN
jgi:hypothetical protein